MNSDKNTPLTVEALMRLKRLEQPPAEFWTQFDKELRVKQLAAIVERRPWWHGFPRVYSLVSRHPLALGSAAALTIAVFTATEYRGSQSVSPVASGDYAAAAPAGVVAPVRSDAPASASVPARGPARVSVSSSSPSVSAKAPTEAYGQELASMIASPMPARSLAPFSSRDELAQMERSERTEVPLTRSLTSINMGAIQTVEPDLMRNALGFMQSFEPPALNRRQVSEPLAQMVSPSEERRSRLLAGVIPASFQEGQVSQVGESAGRYSEDRVYESIDRGGLSADRPSITDRLSIKF